ncbi:MAG: hypothetical protein RBR81_05345 [Bacteroidales bacterium]|jgi:hypothetical protein|nr:hypothetical protein [Bacteroidales bacterium]
MKTFGATVLVLFLFYAGTSCVKIKTLPPEPYIEYTSFEVFDTVDILGNIAKGGRLKFTFEDGNGDLGLNPPQEETVSDSVNLFLTLYRKTGGVMSLAPEDDPLRPLNYRIPYMERPGQNKILKGTIQVTFMYLIYFESDTIKYDFFVKDRANNESNTESTSEIILFENGTY